MGHITLETALALLTEGIAPVGQEEISIRRLPLGRVLAAPVTAGLDQPPFPRSPLDGYALYAADTVGAERENPIVLSVSGRLCAGDSPMERKQERGQAVRIMTGAPIPPDCDCVMAQEDTDYGENRVSLYRTLKPYQNYVFRGEDFRKGEELLPRGYALNPEALAAIAGGGRDRVTVYRRPRVAVVATGDELLAPEQPLAPGKIYNSSLYYLQGRLVQLGAEVTSVSQVGDRTDAIAHAVKQAAAQADLVLTTGGVSVGQRDLLPQVMENLGAERIFHGVDLKPGSPALFTKLDGVPALSLSGNPFAAAATLEILARPLLLALAGREKEEEQTAVLAEDFPKGAPVPRFVRANCRGGRVYLPRGHSSGEILSMVDCNCLAKLPAAVGGIPAGTKVPVIML